MNKKGSNTMRTAALAMLLLFSLFLQSTAYAAERPAAVSSGDNQVTFSHLSALAPDESIVFQTKDSSGNLVSVGIERAAASAAARSAEERWRVWYTGGTINAEFHMTVSNNRVTSVSDDMISTFGGSYSNEQLTKTSTYGKLSFQFTSIGSIISKSCWLKGTVTGSDNEITVDWDM